MTGRRAWHGLVLVTAIALWPPPPSPRRPETQHGGDRGERRPLRRSGSSDMRWTCSRADGRSSASTPSATKRSGATRSGSTRPSRARGSAASDPGSARPRRSRVGLKVDAEALPRATLDALRQGAVDLERSGDHAGAARRQRRRRRVGAVASATAGCGRSASSARSATRRSTTRSRRASARRLDGWPNRDLNVGAIIALAPDLSAVADLLGVDEATVRTVLAQLGARASSTPQLFLDGKAFRPDGKTAATLIPAAFGLAGVNLHT